MDEEKELIQQLSNLGYSVPDDLRGRWLIFYAFARLCEEIRLMKIDIYTLSKKG